MAGDYHYLHTSSVYAPLSKNLVSFNRSEQQLQERFLDIYLALREKELEFYRRFGYNSAEDFFQGVKLILQSSEKDLSILRNFSSTRLRQSLKAYSKNALAIFGNKNLILSLKMEKNFDLGEELGKVLQEILGQGGSYVQGNGRLNIGMRWDTKMIKRLINASQNKRFKVESTGMDSLLQYLRDNTTDLIEVYEGQDIKNPTEKFALRSGPFNYSTQEIYNSNEKDLIKIREEILKFIYFDLGIARGSADFQDAAKIVLNQVVGQKLIDISFFVGGANSWIENVVGAMGEFQAAIFFNYIAKKCPNKNLFQEITEIIGNQTNNYSQKMHSDLQILESFGIQVKNYGHPTFKGMEKEVDVRLHPLEIASLVSDKELVSFVINSYFNVSLPHYSDEEWNDFFEQNAMELLNLEIPTTTIIPSKVSFYLIGGHLIPGSEILSRAFGGKEAKDSIRVRTSISAQFGYTDLGYMTETADGHPRFLEWWEGYESHWKPTEKNNLGAWDKNISIRTHFTFTPFWNMDMFKIF